MRNEDYATFSIMMIQTGMILFLEKKLSAKDLSSENFKSFQCGDIGFKDFVEQSDPNFLVDVLDPLLKQFYHNLSVYNYLAKKWGIVVFDEHQRWVNFYYRFIDNLMSDIEVDGWDTATNKINTPYVIDA